MSWAVKLTNIVLSVIPYDEIAKGKGL